MQAERDQALIKRHILTLATQRWQVMLDDVAHQTAAVIVQRGLTQRMPERFGRPLRSPCSPTTGFFAFFFTTAVELGEECLVSHRLAQIFGITQDFLRPVKRRQRRLWTLPSDELGISA